MNRENNSEEIIYGRNAVTEAIKSGMPINKVLISSGEISGSLKSIMALIKEKHIVYQFVDKNKLNDITGTKNHQGKIQYCHNVIAGLSQNTLFRTVYVPIFQIFQTHTAETD